MDEPLSREKRASLGTFTPAFNSADDTARYVHEHIAPSTTNEYGSVILQRLADGLFVATQPIAGGATSFNWTLLLERHGPAADFLNPTGYRIVASLHSHPDTFAATRRLNPKWSDAQLRAFMSFYSEADISLNFKERARFGVAYLSGPDGTLLKFQPHSTPAAAGYVQWLDTQGPWSSPHAHDGTLPGAFKKLATVGTLTFLLSSPSWGGSVGEVPPDWQPLQPFAGAPLPLPCGPVVPSRELALNYAWSRIQRKPSLKQQVVILQQTFGERYIASEPLYADAMFDELQPLPAGYHVEGLYLHSRPLPGQYPGREDWLYKNFISPAQLAHHIAQFRRFSTRGQSMLGASLFMRMRDEAILRYRFSGSPEESRLFTLEADGTVGDNGVQAQLLSGALLSREFVLQVARAGELTVEKTSALWDRFGVVDHQWQPYGKLSLPPLSRAFLSADDAARYAHEAIGGRRDRAFAGLVLKRSDGRYVVTEPVSGATSLFHFNSSYPLDRQGRPIILHAGHQLHGRYGSRPALSTVDPAEALRLLWTRQECELDGQMFHVDDIKALVESGVTGYLSGTQHSLIAYQPGAADSAWLSRLSGLASVPAEMVRTLAEQGTLRVMIASELWGPVGSVEVDWGPYVRALEYQRPEQLGYGALFDSAAAAALDRQALAPHIEYLHFQSRYFAFIFKHSDRPEYVCSEWVPATLKTPLLSLVDAAADATPEGFACHGLLYARQWAGNDSAAWLQRFFIEPDDLSDAVAQARITAAGHANGAAIYIAPPEGALLKYQSPNTGSLFEAQSENNSAGSVANELSMGTLEPFQFVRLVAEAGLLEVVRPSPCWDRSGRVRGLWNPYEHLQRRRLSAAFLTMDDAARYVRRRVPIGHARYYGGIILRRDDGWYLATEPVEVPDEVFDIKWIFPDEIVTRGLYPVRTNVVACYHSRPPQHLSFLLSVEQAAVYANMFSTRVLAHGLGTREECPQHYLLAPDGALVSLQLTPRTKAPKIPQGLVLRPRNRLDWLNATLERALRSGEVTPGEFVNRLAEAYTLHVVVGSPMWGEPGQVSAWEPYAARVSSSTGYVRARHDPACTSICVQQDDAARQMHAQVTRRDELSFGYVLKSTQDVHFVATLPIDEAGSKFAHRRVFSSDGYLHRYDMAGLYFCVSQSAEFHPTGRAQQGDGIYKGLFSPADLLQALYQVHGTAERGSQALYISCADGALLKFVVRDARFTQYRDVLKLRRRALSPTDFIRRMAAAGDLHVLVSSDNWPGVGVVDTLWQPGRSIAAKPADDLGLALGPIHAHGDDAARFSQAWVGPFSGKQYMSALLESTKGSCHLPVLAEPDLGFPSTVAERLFPQAHGLKGTGPQLPKDYRFSAAHVLYHAGLDQPETQGENGYRLYFVSWRELGFYLHQLTRTGLSIGAFYQSSRDGSLLSYTPRSTDEEFNLLAVTGRWSAEGGYTQFAPRPSWTIAELARIGALRVVHAGSFWTTPGVLGSELHSPSGPTPGIPAKDEL